MKIVAGMIVFNGNYVLQECIESIYPFISQLLVAEGPVKYWQEQGYITSTDGTNDILHEFYDPDKKIQIIHGQYSEKNEQCNAYIPYMKDDTDYLWNLDCDEIFKPNDISSLISIIESNSITSVGFKSLTFYGGFDHYLTGFEEGAEFKRISKVYPGSYWSTHRPPTIAHKVQPTLPQKHLPMNILADFGIRMYHYSYVFPQQVKQKVQYYKSDMTKENGIDDYFNKIYLSWVTQSDNRQEIEDEFEGVHDFKPSYRGECRTKRFEGEHPLIIQQNMDKLKKKFQEQLNELANC